MVEVPLLYDTCSHVLSAIRPTTSTSEPYGRLSSSAESAVGLARTCILANASTRTPVEPLGGGLVPPKFATGTVFKSPVALRKLPLDQPTAPLTFSCSHELSATRPTTG